MPKPLEVDLTRLHAASSRLFERTLLGTDCLSKPTTSAMVVKCVRCNHCLLVCGSCFTWHF